MNSPREHRSSSSPKRPQVSDRFRSLSPSVESSGYRRHPGLGGTDLRGFGRRALAITDSLLKAVSLYAGAPYLALWGRVASAARRGAR